MARATRGLVLSTLIAACATPRPAPDPTSLSNEAEKTPPDVPIEKLATDYDSTMQVHWSAAPSPGRMRTACNALPTIARDGRALARAFRARSGAGIESTGAALQLEASIDALEQACAEQSQERFDPALVASKHARDKAVPLTRARSSEAP